MKTAKSECKMMDKGRIYRHASIYIKWDNQEFIWCVHERSLRKFLFVDNQKKKKFLSRWEKDEKTWFQGSMTSINRMRIKVQYLLYEVNQLNDITRDSNSGKIIVYKAFEIDQTKWISNLQRIPARNCMLTFLEYHQSIQHG